MIRSILAAAVSVFLTGAAVAADLPEAPASQPVTQAEVFEWAGPYIGVHAGYGWANRDGGVCFFPPCNPAAGTPFDYDQDGWLGGGQVGYNHMLDSNWLIGLEADGSFANIEGRQSSPGLFPGNGEWTWLATATARLGYAPGRYMVYAEGGLGLGGFEYSGTDGCSFDQTRVGFVAGAGTEVKVTRRASIKAEYNYLNFGEDTANCTSFGFLPVRTEADADMHVVKIGVNYLFGY